jgi:hypothetical protein
MYQTMLTHTFESSTSEYHRSSVNEEIYPADDGNTSEQEETKKKKHKKRKHKNRMQFPKMKKRQEISTNVMELDEEKTAVYQSMTMKDPVL